MINVNIIAEDRLIIFNERGKGTKERDEGNGASERGNITYH